MTTATVAAEAVLNIVERSRAAVKLPPRPPAPGARWSMEVVADAWRGALALGTTPFELASQTSIDDWGLLGFIIRTAPTPAESLRAVMSRLALITDRGRWVLSGPYAEWHATAPSSDEDLAATTSTLAHIVVCTIQIAGADAVREVSLRDRSFGAAGWFRDRGIAVRFGADREAIMFGELDAPAPHGHRPLFEYLCAEADRSLETLPRATTTAHVRAAVLDDLSNADADRVARTLAIGTRTLRRRLEEEGTTFRSIVDEVRQREAEAMLRNDVGIADVSDRLGFSDPSAFARAFRRWSGRSPREQRRPS